MKRTTSLVLAALIPAAVAAQSGKATNPKGSAPTAIERAAPVEGSGAAADRGLGAVPPPDTYTIRPGDTLWDLSGRFLNNPWYWPKVWSFNPEITNPHWIEPGNVLKFYPSAEEAPARVEPAPAALGRARWELLAGRRGELLWRTLVLPETAQGDTRPLPRLVQAAGRLVRLGRGVLPSSQRSLR